MMVRSSSGHWKRSSDDPEQRHAGPPSGTPGMLLHDLMGDLAAQERTEAFEGARDALVRASAVRHALATVEHRE